MMNYDLQPVPGEDGPVNTEYFPEETARTALRGCNHDFALALHRRTGWPIAAFWKDPSNHPRSIIRESFPMHTFCVAPDGRAVDVEGAHPVEALRKLWERLTWSDRSFRFTIHGSEAAWAELCEKTPSASTLEPREHRIAGAEKVIAGSTPFLALVDQLKA